MNLSEWLNWIKSFHCQMVDLSLERTIQVAEKLGLLNPNAIVVTVAGTNGKGSCVAGIESIMLAEGYKVGAFTSPFLLRYNEQIRLQGKEVEDSLLCNAFEKVRRACDQVTLTPFEFGTLAALVIFQEAPLDLWILEVGMGGRWDAVNIVEADLAMIASIGIDHVEWLGSTREAIGYEKAGIFRPHQLAVYGDFEPPSSVVQCADSLKTSLFFQDKDFYFVEKEKTWDWFGVETKWRDLPLPSLALQNMSTVLMGIELLRKKVPVSQQAIESGLKKVKLPGRIQVISGKITRILDVSHNPAAVEMLSKYLEKNSCHGKTNAVFSMLADKDIFETVRIIQSQVNYWYVAPLATPRAASMEMLKSCFEKLNIKNVRFFHSIQEANQCALKGDCERLLVFGSFHTVAEIA